MADPKTELVVLKGGAVTLVSVNEERFMHVRFTLPNGAQIDVRHEDGRLHIMGANTGPLAIEPRFSTSLAVSAQTSYDAQIAREKAQEVQP